MDVGREQRRPAVGRVRDVPETRGWPREIPVEHDVDAALAKDGVPRRPIVVTDELIRGRRDHPPLQVRLGVKVRDDIVIAPQQLRCLSEMHVGEHVIRQRLERSVVRLAFDEAEHFAPSRVHADDAWRGKVRALEVAEQRVNGGRPGTGAAMHRVADADRVVEVASEWRLRQHFDEARRPGSRERAPVPHDSRRASARRP